MRGMRRPALGGQLGPTKEDSNLNPDQVFEYSQRLSAQVVALEAENIELVDARSQFARENRVLVEKCDALERENESLREAGFATYQERHTAVQQAHDAVQEKHGQVMLLQHRADQERRRVEALNADCSRLRGMNERLQAERLQMHRKVAGLEATTDAMQAKLSEQAGAEVRAAGIRGDLERHLSALTVEKRRMDDLAGVHYVESAQLRVTREELNYEHRQASMLQDELRAATNDARHQRSEAAEYVKRAGDCRAEAGRCRLESAAAAAEHLRGSEALKVQNFTTEALRRRVNELEDILADMQRAKLTLDAENGTLRSALAAARGEAERCIGAASELESERIKSQRMADQHAAECKQLERQLLMGQSEEAKVRHRAETLRGENADLMGRLHKMEVEAVELRGQVRGADVMVSCLRAEIEGLSMRVQANQISAPISGFREDVGSERTAGLATRASSALHIPVGVLRTDAEQASASAWPPQGGLSTVAHQASTAPGDLPRRYPVVDAGIGSTEPWPGPWQS